ncbi:hypothetical protein JXO52_11940 [bacterium]|nr:hypothetical protein [bacterium]
MNPETRFQPLLPLLFISLVSSLQATARTADTTIAPLFSHLEYRCAGPTRGGRVTAVAGTAAEPGTFYMGATGGGVWKTTDYGTSWNNVSDGYFDTGSIGAISVAPSDPRIVWAGTGSDGLRSNVIYGRGVYRSGDGGDSWTFRGLRDAGQIGAVLIHPDNPDIVFIAAIGNAFAPSPARGVYRTNDSGATWERVLFISERTGAVDLEFAPDDPETIYASMWEAQRKPWTIISGGYEGGLHRSTDGGDSWQKLTAGLPPGLIGKSDLAVSAADPDLLYALIEAPEGLGGVYLSRDRGSTFSLVSTYDPLLDRPFYYCNIDADPTDARRLYVNATGFYRSDDGGRSWERRSTPHGDNHDMWINPDDPRLFIQSNDGGANVTRDGGETWSSQDNQPTAELYQVNLDDRYPYRLYAGQQDNSTIVVPGRPLSGSVTGPSGYWRSVGGCETGPAVPKPGNPDIVYAACKGRFGVYNVTTGQEKQYYVGAADMYGHDPADLRYRFQRVSPIIVSPHNPDVVYHASQYLHRTDDDGVTWKTISSDLTAFTPETQGISGGPITRDITGEEFYSTIYAIAESPLQEGLIWTGSNDGPVYVTGDGGKQWRNVTPSALPPGGRVQTIEPSPHRPGTAYIAVYRYLLGDFSPYLYRTDNYGRDWTLLTDGANGIPGDVPCRVIREDPKRPGLLYAGTESGMFVSFDNGRFWHPLQLNLPAVPVTDIKLFRNDLVISTMGRSFWILNDIASLEQLDPAMDRSVPRLFEPSQAFRRRYSSYRRSREVPSYPEAGVNIDYYLPPGTKETCTLEIRDMSGAVIRRFTSASEAREPALPSLDTDGAALAAAAVGGILTVQPGMQRFTWDMRHAGPYSPQSRRGRSGPMVTPGIYRAVLSAGDWRDETRFTIAIDPPVQRSGVTRAHLKEQEDLSLKIRDLMSEAQLLNAHIGGMLEAFSNTAALSGREIQTKTMLETVDSLLNTGEGPYPQPMLISQISYLYSMLDRADQQPGKDARERYMELRDRCRRIRSEVLRLQQSEHMMETP